jgi:hypothetical protein
VGHVNTHDISSLVWIRQGVCLDPTRRHGRAPATKKPHRKKTPDLSVEETMREPRSGDLASNAALFCVHEQRTGYASLCLAKSTLILVSPSHPKNRSPGKTLLSLASNACAY